MKYSIVICTLGRPALCARSAALLLGDMPPGGELIVVDQSDETGPALQELAKDPRTRIIPLHPPSLVTARNVGLATARGEIIIYVDDDIHPLPGLVQAHLAAYRKPAVGGVAGRVLRSKDDPGAPRDPRSRDPDAGWWFATFDHTERGPVLTARGCNMSFRRDLLLSVGGFDENLTPPFSFREDSDASFAVRSLGKQILFEPDAALVHLESGAGGTRASAEVVTGSALAREGRMYRLHFQHYRNNLYFILKYFRGGARRRLIRMSYASYVGLSRWPWRLAAKNAAFLFAWLSAGRLLRRARAEGRAPDRTLAA